jgi:methylated-DNA-[protein]-cysteine S-methyltransferase
MGYGLRLFDTALGRCGIGYGDHGVRVLQLPEADDARTRARVLGRCPDASEDGAPDEVLAAIEAIRGLLSGDPVDLNFIELDMRDNAPFARRVYEAARTIPPGRTQSYGEIARRLGSPGAARAVGQALGHNPYAIIVPCHRVLAAGGRSGGFSANGGVTTKLRMLAIERANTEFRLEP